MPLRRFFFLLSFGIIANSFSAKAHSPRPQKALPSCADRLKAKSSLTQRLEGMGWSASTDDLLSYRTDELQVLLSSSHNPGLRARLIDFDAEVLDLDRAKIDRELRRNAREQLDRDEQINLQSDVYSKLQEPVVFSTWPFEMFQRLGPSSDPEIQAADLRALNSVVNYYKNYEERLARWALERYESTLEKRPVDRFAFYEGQQNFVAHMTTLLKGDIVNFEKFMRTQGRLLDIYDLRFLMNLIDDAVKDRPHTAVISACHFLYVVITQNLGSADQPVGFASSKDFIKFQEEIRSLIREKISTAEEYYKFHDPEEAAYEGDTLEDEVKGPSHFFLRPRIQLLGVIGDDADAEILETFTQVIEDAKEKYPKDHAKALGKLQVEILETVKKIKSRDEVP